MWGAVCSVQGPGCIQEGLHLPRDPGPTTQGCFKAAAPRASLQRILHPNKGPAPQQGSCTLQRILHPVVGTEAALKQWLLVALASLGPIWVIRVTRTPRVIQGE